MEQVTIPNQGMDWGRIFGEISTSLQNANTLRERREQIDQENAQRQLQMQISQQQLEQAQILQEQKISEDQRFDTYSDNLAEEDRIHTEKLKPIVVPNADPTLPPTLRERTPEEIQAEEERYQQAYTQALPPGTVSSSSGRAQIPGRGTYENLSARTRALRPNQSQLVISEDEYIRRVELPENDPRRIDPSAVSNRTVFQDPQTGAMMVKFVQNNVAARSNELRYTAQTNAAQRQLSATEVATNTRIRQALWAAANDKAMVTPDIIADMQKDPVLWGKYLSVGQDGEVSINPEYLTNRRTELNGYLVDQDLVVQDRLRQFAATHAPDLVAAMSDPNPVLRQAALGQVALLQSNFNKVNSNFRGEWNPAYTRIIAMKGTLNSDALLDAAIVGTTMSRDEARIVNDIALNMRRQLSVEEWDEYLAKKKIELDQFNIRRDRTEAYQTRQAEIRAAATAATTRQRAATTPRTAARLDITDANLQAGNEVIGLLQYINANDNVLIEGPEGGALEELVVSILRKPDPTTWDGNDWARALYAMQTFNTMAQRDFGEPFFKFDANDLIPTIIKASGGTPAPATPPPATPPATPPSAPTVTRMGKVTASALHLRSQPNQGSTSQTLMPYGTKITLIQDVGNGWWAAVLNGKGGFVNMGPNNSYVRVVQ